VAFAVKDATRLSPSSRPQGGTLEPEVRRVIYTTDESVKVPAQFSWPWSCRSPVLVAEVGSCEVSFAGRDAGETRSGWGVGRVRACMILAPQDAVGQQGVLGLGFVQGVVDPRAKRRFWD